MPNSIIFIGSPDKNVKQLNSKRLIKQLFFVHPIDILFRIFVGFMPPFSDKFKKVYVDLLGPVLGFLILAAVLNYGNSYKLENFNFSPTESLCTFSILMALLCFILGRIGQSTITLWEIICLLGYALYGHILAILVSYLCFQERSNFFFFVCLIFFGGLSTLRLALIFITTIPIPAARLLICTIISTTNILYLVFIHFAYMHTTFVYKGR